MLAVWETETEGEIREADMEASKFKQHAHFIHTLNFW